MTAQQSEGFNELHIQVLQFAVAALLANAPNKAALRHDFENASERLEAMQLTYPASERALASARNMRQVFLEMLE
jgi:hypothetical protein